MALILEVPVAYTAAAVVKFHPNSETLVPIVERVPVRVPEVSEERAPLVLRVADARGHIVDYREKDGALMRSLTLRYGDDAVVDVDAANAQAAIDEFTTQHANRTHWPFLPDTYTTPWPGDGFEVRRVIRSDRADRIQAHREGFEYGAAVVQGRLFVPSRGPVWALVDADVTRIELQPEGGHVATSAPVVDGRKAVFPIDRLADAEAHLARWAEETRRAYRLAVVKTGVSRGAVWTADQVAAGADLRPALAALAAHTLMDLGKHALATLPPEAIYAFADLKTILTDERAVPEERLASALRAIADLRAGWEAAGRPVEPGTHDTRAATAERLALAERLVAGDYDPDSPAAVRLPPR